MSIYLLLFFYILLIGMLIFAWAGWISMPNGIFNSLATIVILSMIILPFWSFLWFTIEIYCNVVFHNVWLTLLIRAIAAIATTIFYSYFYSNTLLFSREVNDLVFNNISVSNNILLIISSIIFSAIATMLMWDCGILLLSSIRSYVTWYITDESFSFASYMFLLWLRDLHDIVTELRNDILIYIWYIIIIIILCSPIWINVWTYGTRNAKNINIFENLFSIFVLFAISLFICLTFLILSDPAYVWIDIHTAIEWWYRYDWTNTNFVGDLLFEHTINEYVYTPTYTNEDYEAAKPIVYNMFGGYFYTWSHRVQNR